MRDIRILRSRPAMAVAALALFVGIGRTASAALIDITAPSDQVIIVNGQNDGDTSGGPPPLPGTPPNGGPGEQPANIIDNTTNKYLNFLDLGSGVIINPATSRIGTNGVVVTGLRLYTANDSEPRDPATYILEGSHTVSGPFTLISQGPLALPSGRNAIPSGQLATPPTPPTPINPDTQFQQTILFPNTVPYISYRLTFPTLKGAGPGIDPNLANSMQIGEIELLQNVVPEPTSLAGLGIGALGLLARRRRA
jgi:hypothetical protein